MSKNLGFKRMFFILKNEYSNMRKVNAKGYGKLELKNNRLNIAVNIDNAEIDTYYDIILIGDNKIHEVGRIYTDNRGDGQEEFILNYIELEMIDFPLEKINGILILRDENVLLGGYLLEDDSTIENFLKEEEPIQEEPIQEESEGVQEEILEEIQEMQEIEVQELGEVGLEDEIEKLEEIREVQETETIEEPEIIEEIETETETEDPVEAIENLIIEDETIIEEDIIETEEVKYIDNDLNFFTKEEYENALTEIFHEDDADNEDDENVEIEEILNPNPQTINYVLNILSFFPYIEPFKLDLMGYNWWRIDVEELVEEKAFLPYFSYVTGGNTFQDTITANRLMKNHGHYLFGLYNTNDKIKFYLYAVPGAFTKEDHPQNGITGFNTWFEGRDDKGYWVLYIDPFTGRIIYPINPMLPKD